MEESAMQKAAVETIPLGQHRFESLHISTKFTQDLLELLKRVRGFGDVSQNKFEQQVEFADFIRGLPRTEDARDMWEDVSNQASKVKQLRVRTWFDLRESPPEPVQVKGDRATELEDFSAFEANIDAVTRALESEPVDWELVNDSVEELEEFLIGVIAGCKYG